MILKNKENKSPKKIYYFSSTHWDREWYKTYQSFRVRLVDILDDAMDMLERNKEFTHFTLDGQTAVLDDYLEVMPENRERLKKHIKEGRISVGPWYTQPDEYLVSGESIIANLILGHKKSSEFDVQAMKYGYLPDTFGHIAQLPQILKGFGIDSAMVGRGLNDGTFPAFFNWEAPDKSRCTTYKVSEMLGYGTFFAVLPNYLNGGRMTEEVVKEACDFVMEEMERTHLPFVVLMDGLDHQPIHEKGAEIAKKLSENFDCPVVFDSLEELGKEIEAYKDSMVVKTGELNKTGKNMDNFISVIRHTLSSRYDIKQANDRAQQLLEKWMLPVSAMARLKGASIPRSYQDIAYRYLVLNHAHDSICGCSIDEVHQDMHHRFKQVMYIGEEITDKAMGALMDIDVKTSKQQQTIRIYNPLLTERHETVSADIVFEPDYPYNYKEAPLASYEINAFHITDMKGDEVPYQIENIKKNSLYKIPNGLQNQERDIYHITFDAKLPASGYAQYFVVPSEKPTRYLNKMSDERLQTENEFIRLTINADGTLNIYDKKTDRSYDKLNSLVDNSDIGNGWHHVSLANDVLCYSDGANKRIEKVSDGTCSTTFKITTQMEIPGSVEVGKHSCSRSEAYVTLEVASYVTLGRQNRWVDIKTVIHNNAKDHRLKVLFPTGIHNDEYYASQAFTFVKRRTGSDLSTGDWKEYDKPENNFEGIVFKKDEKNRGIAFMSAYGLHECEALTDNQGTLAITLLRSFGQTVYTDGQTDGQIQGELVYKYRLFPFNETDTLAYMATMKDKLSAGIKCITTYCDRDKAREDYLNQKSFNFISNNLVVSSVQSAKEDADLIIRVFNCSGSDAEGVLISPYEIASVFETDLLENIQSMVDFDDNAITFIAAPWKIKTYKISFDKIKEIQPQIKKDSERVEFSKENYA